MMKIKFREIYKFLLILTFGFFLFIPTTSYSATINVIYNDGPGEGFNDPVLGAARQNAMQFAINKLGAEINSNIVINVEATFDPLGGGATSAPLAGAQANTVHMNFSGAPVPNTWYPAALANAISGTDLAPSDNDILIIFNSDVDNPVVLGDLDWDYGLSATGDIDFVTVAMHELSHGLGFFGTIAASGSWEILNTPSIYDRNLVYNNVGSNLINLDSTNNATRAAAVTSGNLLLWDGANVTARSSEKLLGIGIGGRAEMYAPLVYQDGSSVSHFSDSIFPFELLAPFYIIPNHDLDWTLALFEDIGWTLTSTPVQITIDVNKSGTGTGTVTSLPAGINCGSTCSAQYNQNSGLVTLTAVPDSGSVFVEWQGDCTGSVNTCNVPTDNNKSVNAVFDLEGPPNNPFQFEFGKVNINHTYQLVTLANTYVNPVVVAKPLGFNGTQSALVIINNVTSNSFDIRIKEWEFLDGSHDLEEVSYMVMEAGHFTLEGGVQVEAGSIDTDVANPSTGFQAINFFENFSVVPVVATSVMTENGSDAVVTRNRNVSTSGFEVSMQEQEANDQIHVVETIGYIAWEAASGILNSKNYDVGYAGDYRKKWSQFLFNDDYLSAPCVVLDMQTTNDFDTANLRFRNKFTMSMEISVREEKSSDNEFNHSDESVGFFIFGDIDSTPPPPPPPPGSLVIEAGTVTIDHNGTTVNLNNSYTNPVILAKPLTFNGTQSALVRINNVTSNSFHIRIKEWEFLDGSHNFEDVSYVVIEAGSYDLGSGVLMEAGNIDTNSANVKGSFHQVNFSTAFSTTPVVATTIITENDPTAVVTRNKLVDPTGFDVILQEEEGQDTVHSTETISYLAIETGSGVVNDLMFEVASGFQVNNNFSLINYQQSYSTSPFVILDMQTTKGKDTANLRYSSKTTSSIQVKVSEENSADTEQKHINETIGYILFVPTS